MTVPNTHSFYVGTYTDGNSKGIYKYELTFNGHLKSAGLVATTENPSFLALTKDKRNLVAINEVNNREGVGTVEAYAVSGETLTLLNRQSSGGAHPCFVSINDSGHVLTANYTGGNIGLLKLETDGSLSELLDVQQHTGKGISDRQEAPHAHSVWTHPGDGSIIAVDLGTNELWFSRIEDDVSKLVPAMQQKLAMAPGAGPRHLAFHPTSPWIYVVNELNSSITRVDQDNTGEYVLGTTVSTLPDTFSGTNTCADIHVSSDGRFVYASNRGHNSIAVLAINQENGDLSLLGNKGCGGDGPRNFAFSPEDRFILVANQHTNNIVSLKRNPTTGLLKYVDQTEAPTPVCIAF